MTSGQTPPLHPPKSGAENFLEQLQRRGVLVIANPKSGQGDSPLPKLLSLLEEKQVPVTRRELEGEKPMHEYASDVTDFAAVIGAGGDGTVSALAYAMQNTDVPLFALPAGTANLIALNLNVPETPEEMLELLLSGRTMQIDLGELRASDGEPRGFAMLAGAGVDAAMIKESEKYKKQFGMMAYIMAAMKQVNPKVTHFCITADGEKREFTGMAVMVANFGMANYRLPITSDISPTDGKFTIIMLKGGNVLKLLPNLLESVKAKFHLGDPRLRGGVETFNAAEITVTSDDPLPLQYDGEIHKETTPFSARVLPGAIRFFTYETPDEIET